ncbi:MAG: HAMP domain-containing histidine kinase [Oscillospiraceae bacterium]|nr:HAMP domain-containing histidine kinase [Oscillospiraceae bacterium]
MECWYLLIFLVIIFLLIVKIYLLKKSTREIRNQLAEKLSADTNTLIDVSSGDKDICKLASDLNKQLKLLRCEYIRCKQGDLELKNAVTNISHDLRTPLTAIISYLDLIESNPEKSEQYIKIIRERTETLSRLTEELFRYSVITSPEYDNTIEPVVINSVLEESILSYYATLQKHGITPDINITENSIVRNISRHSLSRVFANLLNNAVKYSDGDLQITMTDDGIITFSNKSSYLNKVQIERLFDRFYTVENARKSTGLGLSIARILIEQMNGKISAEYSNGKLIIRIILKI